ncbi:DEAD/DEAH box helicase [Alicyclobacillus shizuokensis]|uniref:DEAD/DEAH box helicase n=1 Tax=Alicyclobacillus shizuokensis TaxID=392014 RepID=UPI0009F84A24|nr:SNF2-related protein [Alicyclobacillus shizuokensis]
MESGWNVAVRTPPIQDDREQLEHNLAEFLSHLHETDNRSTEWILFQLQADAVRARLAEGFDQLLALEHLQGFTPLPHQVETAHRVLRDLRGRAILADEVGLGKTIEAGLILKEYLLRGLVRKALILVPASLVLQWTRELNEKFRIPCFAQRNEWTWSEHDIIVASLDTAKREPHRTAVLGQAWDLVIVDEAHKLKNPRTRNWQIVNQIPNKFLLLLTATPMQNDLRELHTLITLLRPGHLGNSREFARSFVESRRTAKRPETLREQVSNVLIRNRRRDGSTSLPPRHVRSVPLTLSPPERALYDAVQTFLRTEYRARSEGRASVLPLITLQREICSSPYAAMITMERMIKRSKDDSLRKTLQKLTRMAESIHTYTKVETVLQMLKEIDDKCVVFTEYRATQDFLLYMLKRHGISVVPFRGGFGRGKKDWMKDLFARKVQVLVATESGGEGINLQFCHHMINFDLPWNPMRLEQRIGRIHRLGQTEEVYIHNLATENTIEAHIVQLLQEKIRLFEMIIGELDYIVGDHRLGEDFDRQVMDIAMTSDTDTQLQERLNAFGDRVLQEWKREEDTSLWHA